jgi:hypothetical protein
MVGLSFGPEESLSLFKMKPKALPTTPPRRPVPKPSMNPRAIARPTCDCDRFLAFISIPASIVYKAASLVAKADKIVAVARNLKQADEMWGRVKASKSVANLAGKIWTKSNKYQDIQKGRLTTKGLIGFRNGKPVQYRGPKTKAGKTSANLEQFAKVHGDYATQLRFNFHIQIERGFFK